MDETRITYCHRDMGHPPEAEKRGDVDMSIEYFLRVAKGDFHANILTADFVRLLAEALRPKTLIETCEAIFTLGPREGGHAMTLYEGEAEGWK